MGLYLNPYVAQQYAKTASLAQRSSTEESTPPSAVPTPEHKVEQAFERATAKLPFHVLRLNK